MANLPIKDSAFYQKAIAQAAIPASSSTTYSSIKVVVRDMYVDLKDVYAKIAADKLVTSQIAVYADTLVISKTDSPIQVRAGLTLVARHLVVEEGASIKLDYLTTQMASLVVYTRHIQGTLKAIAITKENNKPKNTEIDLSAKLATSPAPSGAKIYYRNSAVKIAIFQDFSGIDLSLGSPLRMLLATTFQLSTALFKAEKALVNDMLNWIVAVGNSAENGVELNLQSAAFLAELNVASNVSSIPDLSRDFYITEYAALLALAKTYETQYTRFADLKNSLEERKAAATLILDKEKDTADYYQKLVDQANNNFNNAQLGLFRANAALATQNTAVDSAGTDLSTAMEIWLKEQKIKLALDIVNTVLSFAVAIGTLGVGIPSGLGGTVKAATDAQKNTTAFEVTMKAIKDNEAAQLDALFSKNPLLNKLNRQEYQELLDKGKNLAKAAADAEKLKLLTDLQLYVARLKEMMDNLKNSVDLIQKLITNTQQIISAAKTFQRTPQPIKLPDEPGSVSGTPEIFDLSAFQDAITNWDIFQITVEGLLQPLIIQAGGANGSAGFLNASTKYLAELKKLVIYGKAVVTSQIAAVQFGREVSNLILQKQISDNQKTRLEKYIVQLSQDVARDEELMQLLFNLQLNSKRWLYISLMNYKRAYHYWALQDSSIEFSITQPVSEFERNKTQIEADFKSALNRFKPRVPQTLNKVDIVIPKTSDGEYKDVISNFIKTGEIRFTINLTEENFKGYERVRLNRVRVWLEGVNASDAIPVQLSITNIGTFSDRLTVSVIKDGKETQELKIFTFSGPILERTFGYQGVIGDAEQIKVDGDVAEDMNVFYSQPTPFTNWIIKAPKDYKYDLTNLTAFRVEFAGTVIGKVA